MRSGGKRGLFLTLRRQHARRAGRMGEGGGGFQGH